MKTKKQSEIYLGGGYLNVQTSQLVETKNMLTLKTSEDNSVSLEVKVSADFSTLPEKYHEVFLNIFSAKYCNSVSFGDNPFSQCQPIPKNKWWQFWKANLNIQNENYNCCKNI